MSVVGDDYREVLLQQFQDRRERRPSYSMRAYARDLGITPSNLSDILKRRCGLSASAAMKISQALKMSDDEAQYFADLVESKHGRNKIDRQAAIERVRRRRHDPFAKESDTSTAIFSDWSNLALLELIDVKKGIVDATTAAQALGLTPEAAERGLTYLIDAGYVGRSDGKYKRLQPYVFGNTAQPSTAIRDFHRQVLTLAADGLNQEISQRKFLSTFMTFDSKRIEEARAFLEEVDRQFFAKFEATDEADSVYAVGLQLFRVDR